MVVTKDGGQYLGRVAVGLVIVGGRCLGVGERGESREKLNERYKNKCALIKKFQMKKY